jgi:hypothetical protein
MAKKYRKDRGKSPIVGKFYSRAENYACCRTQRSRALRKKHP